MEFSHHFCGMHYAWWIFWILVVCALLMRRGKTSHREIRRETLRQRYAAGEITEEEYKDQLSVLEQTDNRKHKKTHDRSTESAA